MTLTLALLLVSGTALAAQRWLLPDPADGEVLTLLLLGSDGGPPRPDDLRSARADGFQLLFVAPDRQHATFISIPRDSWVPVPGRGTTRINSCLVDGPERCVQTVESLFGLEVDGYLLTSMRGFARAAQAHGGIVVDVPTSLTVGGTTVAPGDAQRLRGNDALVYARDRQSRSGGDFARSRAQAELLASAHAELTSSTDPAAFLDALAVVRRYTVTDIPPTQLLRWGAEALHLPPENVRRELAPARVGTAGAASVVFLEDAAYALIADAAADGRLED